MEDKEHLDRLNKHTNGLVNSTSQKCLVVSGPGSGKTTSFKKVLDSLALKKNKTLVVTFLGSLKKDLEKDLGEKARVFTFHGYCHFLLRTHKILRNGLSDNFEYYPNLEKIIKSDWGFIKSKSIPDFENDLRTANHSHLTDFVIQRSNYYNAIGFDDSVFRTYFSLVDNPELNLECDLVLVDEFQDFNKTEAEFVKFLGDRSKIIVAGDDDQALYEKLRLADPSFISELYFDESYEKHELPYCTRCTKVVIDSVNDVINKASSLNIFTNRIPKKFEYCPPIKRVDSEAYPKIISARISAQINSTNYFGKYVSSEIKKISVKDIIESNEKGFPTVLIIASNPIRDQIKRYVEFSNCGEIILSPDEEFVTRDYILRQIKKNNNLNLWWRVLLDFDKPKFESNLIKKSYTSKLELNDIIPIDYKKYILKQIELLAEEVSIEKVSTENSNTKPTIKITSFEGSKGLSASHVFIAGLQNGQLPKLKNSITSAEVKKFLVALTRTRKCCHLIYSNRIAGRQVESSLFINWIKDVDKNNIYINKDYLNNL